MSSIWQKPISLEILTQTAANTAVIDSKLVNPAGSVTMAPELLAMFTAVPFQWEVKPVPTEKSRPMAGVMSIVATAVFELSVPSLKVTLAVSKWTSGPPAVVLL